MSTHRKVACPSREATRRAWKDRLDRFAVSDGTVAAFCQRERVSLPTFYYWKRRLGREHPAATDALRLLPVGLAPAPTPLELILPDGLVLRLTPGCDLDFVRTLVQALGRSAC